MKRLGIVVAAVLVVALGVVVYQGATGAWSDRPSSTLGPPVVAASVPGHELLNDALRIDASWRKGGILNFAYLPATRPPDLRRMEATGSTDGAVDLYEVGTVPLHTVVAYGVDPPSPCPSPAPGPQALCLRSGPTSGDSPDAPSLRYATVHLTGGAEPGDPVTDRAAAFWARNELIPIARATWFSALVQQAKIAAGAP